MKLTKIRVTDFQSVRDSTEFKIGDVTCLVGKNEAGKTALLQAMYRLLPIVETDGGYSVTDDYPRRDVADYEHAIEEEEREHAVVAQLTYELDDADAEAIAKVFGPKALASREITISRAYEQDAIMSVSSTMRQPCTTFCQATPLRDETRKILESCSTPAEAKGVVTDLEQTEAIQNITERLNEIISAGSVKDYICDEILSPLVPRFLYFDEYYQIGVATTSKRSSSGLHTRRLRSRTIRCSA